MTTIIVAMTAEGGIGLDGEIPWVSHEDMRFFYAETTRKPEGEEHAPPNAVIMGRATWESLPRALRGRVNVVLSARWARMSADEIARETGGPAPDVVAESFSAALDALAETSRKNEVGRIFAIGGERVFSEALLEKGDRACDELIVTHILPLVPCDRKFPIALAVEAGFAGLAETPIGGAEATVCDEPLPIYAPACVFRRYARTAAR
jgi:dihydrofolate reductase